MNILITGGTGFIGSALCMALLKAQHQLTVLTRQANRIKPPMTAISHLQTLNASNTFDVVINLAGEPIADKRWSDTQKQRIRDSRLQTTQQLIDYFQRANNKPALFISGSAIGYYGIAPSDAAVDETGAGDDSFSSRLCQQWEQTALQAQDLGIRTCLLRTGIVLGQGGALAKMLLPFKLGLGGKIGNGQQWMPWIHLEDLVGILLFCIDNENIHGAINGTAPNPVRNDLFSQTLAKVLHRPAIFPMPAFVVKVLMGQMGEELLLSGKKVMPQKMLDVGYQFHYSQLQKALEAVIR